MLSCKSARVNNRSYLYKQWLLSTFILSTPVVVNVFYPFINLKNNSFLYYYIFLVSLNNFITISRKDRVNEVGIDTNRQIVYIRYYDVNKGIVEKSFAFNALKVKIVSSKRVWFTEPVSIRLFAGRKETFEIARTKDGFTTGTMMELKNTLESLTSPVS